MLLSIWVITIFGLRISGAHYNPALSLAHTLRKDAGSFPIILGVAYCIAQIFGAFIGALISWFLVGDFRGMNNPDVNSLNKLEKLAEI